MFRKGLFLFFIENGRQQPASRLELARRESPAADDRHLVGAIAAGIIAGLAITTPPVDLGLVASLLGIHQIVQDDDLPAAGCLRRRDDGQFEIRVRNSDTRGRQRFTVAHECSHTFFPGYAMQAQHRCQPTGLPEASRGIEALCDLGASELLLPSKLFAADVSATSFDLAGLTHLADRYGASIEATAHRLVTVWRQPAAVLVLSVRRKPRDLPTARPQLRLDYAHARGEWPYFIRHKSTSAHIFERALRGEVVTETTTLEAICNEAIRAEIHAQSCPVTVDGERRERVLVLARRRWAHR